MRIKKFIKMLTLLCVASSMVNICVGQVYKERVRVLAVENRFALVQLGFDISDALKMDYIVFDSTASDFDHNVVYVWNDGVNDWVKTTMPALLNGSLFYNKIVTDIIVITDSLNSIQQFGESASWAPQMFVINKLDYPNILNSINERYKFTPPQWHIFSSKYRVVVENVATNSSKYMQPLWDFSLPNFTVEARKNSVNANLTPKEFRNSSVEVVIVDTEFLSTPEPTKSHMRVENIVMVGDEDTLIIENSIETTPKATPPNSFESVVEEEPTVEVEANSVLIEPVVSAVEVEENNAVRAPVVVSTTAAKAMEKDPSITPTNQPALILQKSEEPTDEVEDNRVISVPVVVSTTATNKSVYAPIVELSEEYLPDENITSAPEVD